MARGLKIEYDRRALARTVEDGPRESKEGAPMKTEKNNVISLFGAGKIVPSLAKTPKDFDVEKSAESFLNSMKKNVDNAERMRQERLKANKSVLRTYNIKD